MKLILDIVWEFWSAALQTLCAAVVFVTALVTAFSPIWLPLGACYYWQLEGLSLIHISEPTRPY